MTLFISGHEVKLCNNQSDSADEWLIMTDQVNLPAVGRGGRQRREDRTDLVFYRDLDGLMNLGNHRC